MRAVVLARLRSLAEPIRAIIYVWLYAIILASVGLLVAFLLILVGSYGYVGVETIKWGLATRSLDAVLVGSLPIVGPLWMSYLIASWEDDDPEQATLGDLEGGRGVGMTLTEYGE